jgi:CheY-like chemotaxis protein
VSGEILRKKYPHPKPAWSEGRSLSDYCVGGALCGELSAEQTAAAFRPDVVLLDIGLPKMNGYEVARQIKKQPWGQGLTLIALTGWGQDEDKRRALAAGFDHHVTKPVQAATLERLLALIKPLAPD